MGQIEISVVIPAYNEATQLPRFLERLMTVGSGSALLPTEIIVVDDGSEPKQAEAMRTTVEGAAARLNRANGLCKMRFVSLERNSGKGSAIRAGWSNAALDVTWLGFLDADGAISAEEFWRLVRMVPSVDADVLAGTRIRMAGRSVDRNLFRHLQGRVFATLVEQLFSLGFYDSQCGVKLFRADLLRPFLPQLREQGWLLDVELLALLKRHGGRLVEEPIDWADPGGSKVRFGIDPIWMLFGLLRLWRRFQSVIPSGQT